MKGDEQSELIRQHLPHAIRARLAHKPQPQTVSDAVLGALMAV